MTITDIVPQLSNVIYFQDTASKHARKIIVEQAPYNQLCFYKTEQNKTLAFRVPIPWTYFVATSFLNIKNNTHKFSFDKVFISPYQVSSLKSPMYHPHFPNLTLRLGYPCVHSSFAEGVDAITTGANACAAWWESPFNAHYAAPRVNSQACKAIREQADISLGYNNVSESRMSFVKEMFSLPHSVSMGDIANISYMLAWSEIDASLVTGDHVVSEATVTLQQHLDKPKDIIQVVVLTL